MDQNTTCALCGSKYDARHPGQFKERKNGGGFKPFRSMTSLERGKLVLRDTKWKDSDIVGKVICVKCRGQFKESPKKRKIDNDFEIIEKQRQLVERNEKNHRIASKAEADGIYYIFTQKLILNIPI